MGDCTFSTSVLFSSDLTLEEDLEIVVYYKLSRYNYLRNWVSTGIEIIFLQWMPIVMWVFIWLIVLIFLLHICAIARNEKKTSFCFSIAKFFLWRFWTKKGSQYFPRLSNISQDLPRFLQNSRIFWMSQYICSEKRILVWELNSTIASEISNSHSTLTHLWQTYSGIDTYRGTVNIFILFWSEFIFDFWKKFPWIFFYWFDPSNLNSLYIVLWIES